MRIGILAHALFSGHDRNDGISQYIRYLLGGLQNTLNGHDVTAFVHHGFQEAESFPRLRFQVAGTSGISPWRRLLYEQFAIPRLARQHRLDVVHGTSYALPIAAPCPGLVMVHDLCWMHAHDYLPRHTRLYLDAMTRASTRRAKIVLVPSAYTGQDVVRRLGVSPERIRVVYLAADPEYRAPSLEAIARFRQEKSLDFPYILFVGTITPRKNLWRLLQAFAEARRQGMRHHLVVVGRTGWLVDDLPKRMEADGLMENVHFVGFAPQEEMSLWYGAADIFAYPSLLEGFGLPIVEAMACGAPVVTSNITSMPEIGGDAAAYVTPTDVADMAKGLMDVATDPGRRIQMREAGFRRAASFHWNNTAQETLQAYQDAVR